MSNHQCPYCGNPIIGGYCISCNHTNLEHETQISRNDLRIHLKILGNRSHYCIVGGKHVWNEEKERYMIPKGKVFTYWVPKSKVIAFTEAKNILQEQVWISLNAKEKDTITGVTAIHAIWIDFDAPRTNKTIPASRTEKEIAFNNCTKFKRWMYKEFNVWGFKACSGNGYHLFYPITPYKIDSPQRIPFNQKHRLFLNHLSEESNIHIDTTTDIRRVTQAIGSLNLKLPHHPLKTYWIGSLPARMNDVHEANNILILRILQTKKEKIERNRSTTQNSHRNFEEILSKDDKIRTLYYGNWQGYKSRSEGEISLITSLFIRGFSESEVREIMDNCLIGKWKEQDAYRDITIEKGMEYANSV